MNNEAIVYIGVDVSKDSLSINAEKLFVGDISNTPAEIKKTLKKLRKQTKNNTILHVCYESTGIYGDNLFKTCMELEIRVSVLNPTKVRHYAKSMSDTAKTDPIDARLIRLYSETKKPLPNNPINDACVELRKFIVSREALTKSVIALSGTLESVKGSEGSKTIKHAIVLLKKEIKTIDNQIKALIKSDEVLNGIATTLCRIKCVGILTAAKIIAYVPEIGNLGKRKVGAVTGLAPHNKDSGKIKGKVHITGGRAEARKALYMPALSGIKYNLVLKALYMKKTGEGKPPKVALVAVMHKLVIHMDSEVAKWRREHDFYTAL